MRLEIESGVNKRISCSLGQIDTCTTHALATDVQHLFRFALRCLDMSMATARTLQDYI